MIAAELDQTGTDHGTVVIERTFRATPARLFRAWADDDARARWGRPSPDSAMRYEQAEFRVGGRDVYRCGSPDLLQYKVIAAYFDIVASQRIVFVEHIHEDETPLSVSLVTVELAPCAEGVRQKLTIQVVALDGAPMIEGVTEGWGAAMAMLEAELASG